MFRFHCIAVLWKIKQISIKQMHINHNIQTYKSSTVGCSNIWLKSFFFFSCTERPSYAPPPPPAPTTVSVQLSAHFLFSDHMVMLALYTLFDSFFPPHFILLSLNFSLCLNTRGDLFNSSSSLSLLLYLSYHYLLRVLNRVPEGWSASCF